MPLSAGELNRRVSFYGVTKTSDGVGGYVEAWGALGTVPAMWANVLPLRGAELVAAQQLHADARYRVTCRWRSDITADMALTWYEGTVRHALAIVAVLPHRMDGALALDCREIRPAEIGL